MCPSKRRPEDRERVIKTTRQMERERKMQSAMESLAAYFGPGVGVMLFVFDSGSKGYLSYKGNIPRADGVDVLKTWFELNG